MRQCNVLVVLGQHDMSAWIIDDLGRLCWGRYQHIPSCDSADMMTTRVQRRHKTQLFVVLWSKMHCAVQQKDTQ